MPDIVINIAPLAQAFEAGAIPFMVYILVRVGWIPLVFFLFYGAYLAWMRHIQHDYEAQWRFTLLAIDVPRNNEQSPRAIEQIFTRLVGIQSSPNKLDRYWRGKVQEYFSFELVSLEGYVQFLIYTPVQHRDLVEAAIYAQYPDAQITEVEDYAQRIPSQFPQPDRELYGTDIMLRADDVIPIRTYEAFEDEITQSIKDPMADVLEALSRLGPGEEAWFQIIITPITDHWKEEGIAHINHMLGKKSHGHGGGFFSNLWKEPTKLYEETLSQITGVIGEEHGHEGESATNFSALGPLEKSVVQAITDKISKIGYEIRMRYIYTASRERFSKSRGVSSFLGALQQFNAQHLNGFKTYKTKTSADYFWVDRRIAAKQRRILNAYKHRKDAHASGRGFVLNTAELATIWHFPLTLSVKAPQVKKTESKKAEPPITLPLAPSVVRPLQPAAPKGAEPEDSAPDNLPVV